jgi:replicative DNA helicase
MNFLRTISDNLAEEGLLSCICRDVGRIDDCIDAGVGIDWFLSPLNQEIWCAILDSDRSSDVIEVDVILQFPEEDRSRVTDVLQRSETSILFDQYFKKCRDDFRKRQLMALSMKIDEMIGDHQEADEILESTERDITKLSLQKKESTRSSREVVDSMWENIKARMDVNGMSGIPSGIRELDSMTYGWQPGDLIVIAARTSVGKTAFGCELTLSALRNDKTALFFSLEMKAEAVMQRLCSNVSEVPLGYIIDKTARPEDLDSYKKGMDFMRSRQLWIDDRGMINSSQVRSKARKLARKGLDFIVVDYAQKMTAVDPRIPREQQVAEIAGSMKSLAMELNVPVILLSQLNRGADELNRKPRLSDIRESGALEQDADVVALLWRKDDDPEQTIISISKQRQGRCGDVPVCFKPKIQKFTRQPKLH